MFSNSKLLVVASFIVIISGLGFLWFGLSQPAVLQPTPDFSIPQVVENSPPATSSATEGIEGERIAVSKVIDGDTIELENGQTVRLIGIDTPETVDPRRPVGCFGKEASSEVKSLLSGKVIVLEKDVSETDKYKRLLRYVYLPLENNRMLFVNDYLVREGYAKVLTYPPDVKYNERFRRAEQEARADKRGLWGKC